VTTRSRHFENATASRRSSLKATSINQVYISEIETGTRIGSLDALKRLAAALRGSRQQKIEGLAGRATG
jgi:transcriptional regulator with XRE-family HTH domain